MRIGAFEVNEPLPELNEPHAMVMLQPWIDVGSVGELTLAWLESRLKATDMAHLVRPGEFFDFTRYRPTVYNEDGKRRMLIPNAYVTWAKQKTGNDFIFLHLMEPHNQAEIYIDSIMELLTRLGAKRYFQIGSMYDYVTHTRPLILSGSGIGVKPKQELKKLGLKSRGNYQGPTSIVSQISIRFQDAGLETMSLMVHLPRYTELEEDYLGAVRMMQVVGSIYNIPMDKTYMDNSRKQLEQVNATLEKDPQLKAIIEQLEARYDADAQSKQEETKDTSLSPEVEKFLTEMEKRFKDE